MRFKGYIPRSRYIDVKDVGLTITDNLLKEFHIETELQDFFCWMRGQTCVIGDDGKFAYFAWDYERWLKQGKKKEQGEDWD